MTRPKLIGAGPDCSGHRNLLRVVGPLQGATTCRRSWRLGTEGYVGARPRIRDPRARSRAGGSALTNLDKVLYPATGFTKGQVVDYYARIGPTMLPHLDGPPAHDGPLARRGRRASGSSRSAAPATRPTGSRPCRVDAGLSIQPCVDRGAARRSSGWPTSPRSSSTRPRPAPTTRGHPTAMVFDLDPGAPGRRRSTAPASPSTLRDVLDQLGLRCGGEDVGLQGPPPVGAAAHRRRRRRDQGVRARRSGAARERATRSG